MAEHTDELKAGDRIGDRYVIEAIVGRGRMGSVYKCRHEVLGREVAIKTLQLEYSQNDRIRGRFEQEARLLSRLDHQNLISVSDFGYTAGGAPYLVMDFAKGEQLFKILQREGHISPERAISLFIQVCDGLYHAHQRDIIHRDLKPPNIVVDKNNGVEKVKIVDLGIAKIFQGGQDETEAITKAGEAWGSPAYLSPEQRLFLELDNRTDIYSLGACLYECLTGIPPLKGQAVSDTPKKYVYEMPPRFSVVAAQFEIPARLEEVVFRCLAKDKQERYETVMQVKHELMRSRKSEFDTIPVNILPQASFYPEKVPGRKSGAVPAQSRQSASADAPQANPGRLVSAEVPQTDPGRLASADAPQTDPGRLASADAPQTDPGRLASADVPQANPGATESCCPQPDYNQPGTREPEKPAASKTRLPKATDAPSPRSYESAGSSTNRRDQSRQKTLFLFLGACLIIGLSTGIGYATFVNKNKQTPAPVQPANVKNSASAQPANRLPTPALKPARKTSPVIAKKTAHKTNAATDNKHNPDQITSSAGSPAHGSANASTHKHATHGTITSHSNGVRIVRHPDGRVDVYDTETDSGPAARSGSSENSYTNDGDVSIRRHADGTIDVMDSSPETKRH